MPSPTAVRAPRSTPPAASQRLKAEVAKARVALACRIEARAQHQETASYIVVVAGHLHAAVEPLPSLPSVAGGVKGNDVAAVGDAHAHSPPVGIGGPAALGAILVGDEALLVEAEAAIELLVVEQEKPCHAAGTDLDIAFELVGRVAGNQK